MIATQKLIGSGAECEVFETDNPDVVFKLYNSRYTKQKVQQIINYNRDYAKRKLAPQVLSGIIKQDGKYGYCAERVEPQYKSNPDLADKLGIDERDRCELLYNWGYTKDGTAVLLDFGPVTLYVLGISEL